MVAVNNNILPDVDAPGRMGDVMGMYYDEARQCWRLDYPCRIDGKPTHLKATVTGPKRATQHLALQKWLELREKAIKPEGSLTFSEAALKYKSQNPRMGDGIIRIVDYLCDEIGSLKMCNFQNNFVKWIAAQSKRNVMIWRRVDGKLKLCDTGKQISKSTIQSYMRYAKAIVRLSGHGGVFEGITIGKRIVRRRAIESHEMLLLEEACKKLYPWFYPAFDFARCNPIRPEDQFALTVEEHVRGGRIIYAPQKTYSKTGLMAYPIQWEHQADWYGSLLSGLLFPRPDGTGMFGKGKYYQFVWDKIRIAAEVPDVQFYDLRHHAVAWMRSCGISDWRIAKAAGWASTQMIADYDPDNAHLIERYDKAQNNVASRSTESSAATIFNPDFVK